MIYHFYKAGHKIESYASATSYAGGSYTTLGTDYKAFIQPISGSEGFKQGKAGEEVTHRMYCPVSTPAAYGHRVTWNSTTYTMVYTDQPDGISSTEHHKEILLSRFK